MFILNVHLVLTKMKLEQINRDPDERVCWSRYFHIITLFIHVTIASI